MIYYVSGDLFQSGCDALVNAVNCVGVMGKGLALDFKQKYPKNFEQYKAACMRHELKPGGIFATHNPPDPYILNAATKDHWRYHSSLTWVKANAYNIASWLIEHPEVKSIAIPKLGCGLGLLPWPEVRTAFIDAMRNINCDVYLFGEGPN